MTREEKELIFNRLLELEERHPAFAENVRDNAYCEAIADAKRIIDGIKQPSLPSDLDEAAHDHAANNGGRWLTDDIGIKCFAFNPQEIEDAFKAGAEWMAGQGETFETTISNVGFLPLPGLNIGAGDRVVVQIRKKS